MVQAVIIDDEVSNIENLSAMLNKYCPEIIIAGTATNVDQGLLVINKIKPSILFLDVEMPEKNGFDLLKGLVAPDFELIFVTAYYEYAIQAIRFSAIDYLLKPINVKELVHAVNRALINMERKNENERLEHLIQSLNNKTPFRIAIRGNKETVFVSPETILFCKSDNNYTIFHLENGERFMSSKPIFEYEELLSPHGFIRCHQSFLVNRSFIKRWIKVDGDRLLIHGGHEIPVSRNNKEKVRQAIGAR